MRRNLKFGLTAVLVLVSGLFTAASAQVAEGSTAITILHTGDLHGHLNPFKPRQAEEYIGGIARIATLVDRIRAEAPNTILLDAGDTIHGTNLANLFKGESVIAAMNAIGYGAMTVGNHDFNFRLEILAERVAQANFPILAANVRYKTGEPVPFLKPYTIVETGGLKIGIIGLVTTYTPIVTHPRNVEDLKFLDMMEVARDLVEQLKPQVDLIFVVAHLASKAEEEALLEVPGISVLVSELAGERVMQVGDTILVDAGTLGKSLGRLDIAVEEGRVTSFRHQFLPITPAIEADAAVDAVLSPFRAAIEGMLAEVVGEAAVVLEGDRAVIRTRETNLGNLVADILRALTGAEISIQNSGGIRTSIDVGPITLEEIFTVLPFDNYVVSLELTGRAILAALENSVSMHPELHGRFPQVSGMSFLFDPARPAGERIVEVTIGDEPLVLDRTYIVATNDFMAGGGDGYTMLKEARAVLETGAFLRDAVATYIATHSPVAPQVEGRIRKVDQVALQVPRNVIFFHPDGYGLSHWNALRIYLVGPDSRLNWDKLPYLGTYTGHTRNALTGTSQGTATVHAYGVKVAWDSFGLDGQQAITALSGREMSIMEEAIEAGFATALVNSASLTDPGTAAFVASAEGWHRHEEEIARQVIESGVDVILGGGERWLLPEGVQGRHGTGRRADGLDLIERAKELGYTVVYTRDELMAVRDTATRVLGVFACGTTFNAMNEEKLRAQGLPLYWPWAPTIAEMSAVALEILSRSAEAQTRGIFLVVEEEATDDFGNMTNARGSFEAGRRADEAFGVFADFVETNPNTLLIATADSSAGGKQVSGLDLQTMIRFGAVVEGNVTRTLINTGPNGEWVSAPGDGIDGAGTPVFWSAPDRRGERHPFAVIWATNHDVVGDVLVRAKGLNAQRITKLGIVDNTDIYRIMYYTLFGEWLP